MNPPKVRIETETADARINAVRALQAVRGSSLPAVVAEILQIACRGLPAIRATVWRLEGNGRKLRLFCQADIHGLARACVNERIDVQGVLAEALAGHEPHCRSRARLPETLNLAPRTQSTVLMPIYLFDTPLGLLCIELAEPCEPPAPETETFLQLVATKLEAVYLAESSTARGHAVAIQEPYALRQSHLALNDDSLRDLFYLAPTAMLLTDPDDARPVAANQHALELFGISTQRTDNFYTSEFWMDTDDRRRFVELAVSQGHARNYRTRLRRADGKAFWGLVSATLIDYNGRRTLMSSISDVSDTVAAEEILNRTQKTLLTLLEASPYPLIVTRLDTGVIRFCNQKAADMFETALPGLLGHAAPEFYVNPTDRTYFVEKLRSVGKVDGFVAKLKTQSGQPFWAMLSAKTLELNGEPVFMVAFADVTRQKHKEEELENLAFKDGLTNAYNRRYFVEAAQIELGRAERNLRPPAVALIDIDHFKRLNDSHGHDVGDSVLREFVAMVQDMLRKADLLARYGGEEFAILLPETDIETAHAIIERIRTMVAAHPFRAGAAESSVTFSAGIAKAEPDDDYASLLARADDALYDAKRAGRNRIALRR